MTAPDRVQMLLSNAFAEDGSATFGRRGGPNGDVFVDVQRSLGRHGGRLWSVQVAVPFKDGTLICQPVAGIWGAPVHEPLAFIGDVAHARELDVPDPIASKAERFVGSIRALDLGHAALERDARNAVDLLRDVLLAHASGDEEAMGRALDAASAKVVAYSPSLEGELGRGQEASITSPRGA